MRISFFSFWSQTDWILYEIIFFISLATMSLFLVFQDVERGGGGKNDRPSTTEFYFLQKLFVKVEIFKGKGLLNN